MRALVSRRGQRLQVIESSDSACHIWVLPWAKAVHEDRDFRLVGAGIARNG